MMKLLYTMLKILKMNFFLKNKYKDAFISIKVERKIPSIKINGSLNNRLPGNANISFENVNGEELLIKLDQKGICASTGSACSSGSSSPSHVLLAMGIKPSLAYGSFTSKSVLRFPSRSSRIFSFSHSVMNSLSQGLGHAV